MLQDFITQFQNFLVQAWQEIASWEIFGKPSEWFVGIVAGIIGGYITVALISMRVPKLRASNNIVLTSSGAGRIKVINKRRRWWMWSGDALELKPELHFVRFVEMSALITPIPVYPDSLSVLPHRKFIRRSDQNDYVFRVETNYDFATEVAHRKFEYIRFRVRARDAISNYEGIYIKRYYKEGSRHAKRGYKPLLYGTFRGPGNIRIRPTTEQSRRGWLRRLLSNGASRMRGSARS